MIEFYKKRGETPLQALNRLRVEQPELQSEVLSYAGRLDPMAEGILSVLVGKEENILRKDFLNKNKIYHATFVCGISTDTGDVLGRVTHFDPVDIDTSRIEKVFSDLIHIKTQTYPWYSSKTVDGKALFEYAREGKFDIVRPHRDMRIYSVTDITYKEVACADVVKNILVDIKKVQGDFRQTEIISEWEKYVTCTDTLISISCTLNVSSGTYIRALCETLEKELGTPTVLYTLVRTSVY